MTEKTKLRLAALGALLWGPPLFVLLMALFLGVGIYVLAYILITGEDYDS